MLLPVPLLVLLGSRAVAQEAPPPVVPDGATALAVPALPPSYAAGFRWNEAGPRTVTGLSDVAIHPDRADVWAAATIDGSVWVTVDLGRTWLEVLGPVAIGGVGNEDVVGEVQARVSELAPDVEIPDEATYEEGGTLDPEELEQAIADAEAEAAQAAEQAVAEVQADVETGAWYLEQQAVLRGELEHARPRVWFTAGGLLVVGRADGLRVSEDLGGSFAQVLEDPVTALAELPDGRFVAGTPGGMLVSPTLARWAPVPGFENVRTYDLVEDGGLYAATGDGIWFTADLLVWRRLGAWLDDAYTVRPVAPSSAREPRPLVIGADDDVWRAVEPVASPAGGVFGGPIPKALAIRRREDDLLLLAASAAGPFQSTDAGLTWTSLRLGLPDDADARDVEVRGDLVLLASADGLYRLVPVPPEVDRGPVRLAPFAPLGALVDAATARPELAHHVGKRWVAALVPQLSVDGTWNQEVGDDWDADTWTVRAVSTWWQVHAMLTWRPNRQASSSAYFDADALADQLQLLIVDDEVVVDDGTATDVLAQKVNRGAFEYRSELAETIGSLWTTRQRLVLERDVALRDPLVEQVERELRVAELEARLDALTGGAVSDWRADPTHGGTE